MYSRRSFLRHLVSAGVVLCAGNSFGMKKWLPRQEPSPVCPSDNYRNTKFAVINKEGQTVFKPEFGPYGLRFHEGYLCVRTGVASFGFYDRKGNLALLFGGKNVSPFGDGLAYVEHWNPGRGHETAHSRENGFIDATGMMKLSSAYFPGADVEFHYEGFSDGLLPLAMADKWGFVDKNGAMVISPQFDGAEPFHDGLAPIMMRGGWGYIAKSGEVAIDPKFATTCVFSDGVALVENKDETLSYIDVTGHIILDLNMDWGSFVGARQAGDFAEGLVYRMTEDGQEFIDRTGKIVFLTDYDGVGCSFSEGLLDVAESGRTGYINKSGEMVIPAVFEEAWEFHDGLAVARQNGKYGYINQQGDFAIESKYHRAFGFRDGLALVKTV